MPNWCEGKMKVRGELNDIWDIHSEEFLDIAKKFNLDMHLIGFERGMEFKREVYIINGEITEDKTINYVDWDFECEGSELGG